MRPKLPRLARIAVALAVWLPLLGGDPAAADQVPASPELSSLSDEFDDPRSVERWQRFSATEGWPDLLAGFDVGESRPGWMRLEPYTSMWYGEFHGPLVFKEVEGDFVATTRVRVEGLTIEIPMQRFSLGGLMVRAGRDVGVDTWVPGGENWLFMVYGYADRPGKANLAFKNTINSETTREYIDAARGTVDLGIARSGALFVLFYREEGGEWRVATRLWREDLPSRVQVGLTAYSGWLTAVRLHRNPVEFNRAVFTEGFFDMALYADHVRFARPAIPAGMEPADLAGDTVTDEELLTWLTGSIDP